MHDGVFVAERMYQMLEEVLESAKHTAYPYVRTVGDMEWALQNCDGIEDLIVYEARVNYPLPVMVFAAACRGCREPSASPRRELPPRLAATHPRHTTIGVRPS